MNVRFDPRPRTGGDFAPWSRYRPRKGFDPRPRTGGDSRAHRSVSASSSFRSTPPHGGRRRADRSQPPHVPFRSTPPHGGRLRRSGPPRGLGRFDPRPRTGGDVPLVPMLLVWPLFRSTPPHGGRQPGCCHRSPCCRFDPRPRTGGDIVTMPESASIEVSIHAPARGATFGPHRICISRPFRSTPPHGGRPVQSVMPQLPDKFRSTPPHGGRLLLGNVRLNYWRFDPRPRTGGDAAQDRSTKQKQVSIHAPARGATRRPRTPRLVLSFRSTPPHGGRRCGQFDKLPPVLVSIHAPARGATLRAAVHHTQEQFRSTPPHGGRQG